MLGNKNKMKVWYQLGNLDWFAELKNFQSFILKVILELDISSIIIKIVKGFIFRTPFNIVKLYFSQNFHIFGIIVENITMYVI